MKPDEIIRESLATPVAISDRVLPRHVEVSKVQTLLSGMGVR